MSFLCLHLAPVYPVYQLDEMGVELMNERFTSMPGLQMPKDIMTLILSLDMGPLASVMM